MATRKMSIDLELPEELLRDADAEADVARRVRAGVVLDLLRHGLLSQGRAAEMLAVDRWELADVMASHHVPFFDIVPEDFAAALVAARGVGQHPVP